MLRTFQMPLVKHWFILCKTYFENQSYDLACIFLDIYDALLPKKLIENVTNKDFLSF